MYLFSRPKKTFEYGVLNTFRLKQVVTMVVVVKMEVEVGVEVVVEMVVEVMWRWR